MIYFDNNATTQVAPEVATAMLPFLEDSFVNPSSAYRIAQGAKEAVEKARASVASLLGATSPDEIVFTSGGTESDNWAVLGALESQRERRHIVTTAVEHEAVRKLCIKLESQGFEVTWLEVDSEGAVDLSKLHDALRKDTAVVSMMLANNETGILFPIEEASRIVKEKSNALFHVDGVNAVGKIPIDLAKTDVDLFSLSAHKFHGPKGIGALYIRKGIALPSLFTGGGQESGRRAGTEAIHQIVGLGRAAEFVSDMLPMNEVRTLRDRLEDEVISSIPNARLNGTSDRSRRLPNTLNVSFSGVNGEMILAKLDEAGICVSTGSACNSADHTPSPVLQAMGIPYTDAMGAVRLSLGRFNTAEEVETTCEILPSIISELAAIAG